MRRLLARLAPLPPLGPRLWLTLGALVVGLLNLLFLAEIWSYTPHAGVTILLIMWLLLLALPPQLAWWGWRWLRAYTGPGWGRPLATAAYVGVACLGLAAWLLVLVSGPIAAMLL